MLVLMIIRGFLIMYSRENLGARNSWFSMADVPLSNHGPTVRLLVDETTTELIDHGSAELA